MEMIQVQFERLQDSGTRKTGKLVWVAAVWKLKKGDVVSFEDSPDLRWTVVKAYKTVISAEHLDKKWGLALPKSQRTER